MTVGDENEVPICALHSGVHDLGVPEQFVTPAASNAHSLPSRSCGPESRVATYTTPLATAGEETMSVASPLSSMIPLHSGAHTLGEPGQFRRSGGVERLQLACGTDVGDPFGDRRRRDRAEADSRGPLRRELPDVRGSRSSSRPR